MLRRLTLATLLVVLFAVAFGPSAPIAQTASPQAAAQAGPIKLARMPDYHAGKVAFTYLGDIWIANEDGSNPTRLTINTARESYPRFSPDGRSIAFSSNRFGNNDVFVIPSTGGTPRQLTFHSGNDEVVGWSRDGQQVMFRASHGDGAFPSVATLYTVAVTGGPEKPLPVDWGYYGDFSPDGKEIVFNRHPATWTRQHYRGSYAADLWIGDIAQKTYRQVLGGEQLQPLLADVGGGQQHLLRGRSAAERQGRETGQSRRLQEREQHLPHPGERRRPARPGHEAHRRQPVLAVDVQRRQGDRLRRELRPLEARRRLGPFHGDQDSTSRATTRRTNSRSSRSRTRWTRSTCRPRASARSSPRAASC